MHGRARSDYLHTEGSAHTFNGCGAGQPPRPGAQEPEVLLLPKRWFTLCSRCLGRQFQELASISLKQITASRHSLGTQGCRQQGWGCTRGAHSLQLGGLSAVPKVLKRILLHPHTWLLLWQHLVEGEMLSSILGTCTGRVVTLPHLS